MKKILLLLACILLVNTCAGCASDVKFTQLSSEQILDDVWNDGTNFIYEFVDKETGVNYFVYANGWAGGMTARYNADGSLYITED